jgi:hypothetical protein
MNEREYILFCDESDKKGKYFSNFYGGVLVGASNYQRITEKLNALKQELHLFGEVKWEKVTERYLSKYETLIHSFFEEVKAGRVKVRIMFRQNARSPRGLSQAQLEVQYYLLYYQFIKHAFGLIYSEPSSEETRIRLYFDRIPDTKEKIEQFKGYILGLQHAKGFRDAHLTIAKENVTEVHSHDHVLLQCLDIVLGSMPFRLNDKYKEKIPGTKHRGKRTKAKEALYKCIYREIAQILPRFNIGMTTSVHGDLTNRWNHPYRHWCFTPKDFDYEEHLTKGSQRRE